MLDAPPPPLKHAAPSPTAIDVITLLLNRISGLLSFGGEKRAVGLNHTTNATFLIVVATLSGKNNLEKVKKNIRISHKSLLMYKNETAALTTVSWDVKPSNNLVFPEEILTNLRSVLSLFDPLTARVLTRVAPHLTRFYQQRNFLFYFLPDYQFRGYTTTAVARLQTIRWNVSTAEVL